MTTTLAPAVSTSMTLRLAANILDELPDIGRVAVSVAHGGDLHLQAVGGTDHDKVAAVDRICAHLGLGPAHVVHSDQHSLQYGVRDADAIGHTVTVVTVLAKPAEVVTA